MPCPTTALIALVLAASPTQDPALWHQFDFWIGEWSVQNRHLENDGTWRDGDRTRARITPVCAGRAVLEEWAGPFRGGFMNGFSLRAYDAEAEQWNLLLNWTMDGNGSFGRLTGAFQHGRGEFFFPSGKTLNRYTFSDALADTVRWDSATSKDDGATWRTDWIMAFSRTHAAAETTEERLFASDWTEGILAPGADARAMDFVLGTWEGEQRDVRAGTTARARLRTKTINKGCLVIDALSVGESEERFGVRGWVPGAKRWEGWHLSAGDTRLVSSTGVRADGAIAFTGGAADARWTETWSAPAQGELRIELVRLDAAGKPGDPTVVTELRSVP
ncbi:MAG: hypothetical protein GY711_29035 [bacterium]|nr:hypothetical protein [bacterium]